MNRLFFIRHFPDFLFEVVFDVTIQIGQAASACRRLDPRHHFRGPTLFFNLFVNEPMLEHLCGIAFCRNRRLVNRVDTQRIAMFLRLCLLDDFEQRLEFLFWRRQPRSVHRTHYP